MSLADKIAKLDALRERVLAGENPFQAGITLDQWNRIRSGGDWKLHEVAIGKPSDVWDADKYGDVFTVDGAGTLTFEAPGVYVVRSMAGDQRVFFWAHGMRILRNLAETNHVPPPAFVAPPAPPRPLPHIIPWHTARILDFEIPPEVFLADAHTFLHTQLIADVRTALMALMTAFANMPRQSQEAHADMWQAIARHADGSRA